MAHVRLLLLVIIVIGVMLGSSCTTSMSSLPASTGADDSVHLIRVKQLVRKANAGDANAAYALADHYSHVEVDEEAGWKWLRKAATLGNVDAQYELGMALVNIPDRGKSGEGILWLRRAAQKGSRLAIGALEEIKKAR